MNLGSPPSSSHLARNERGGLSSLSVLQVTSSSSSSSLLLKPARLQQQNLCSSSRFVVSGGPAGFLLPFCSTASCLRPRRRYYFLSQLLLRRTCVLLSWWLFCNRAKRTIFYLLLLLFGLAMGAENEGRPPLPPQNSSADIYDLQSNNVRVFCEHMRHGVFQQRRFTINTTCGVYSDKKVITKRFYNQSAYTEEKCEFLHAQLRYLNAQANHSLEDFNALIGKLSCPGGLQKNTSLLPVSFQLDDDDYSLSSRCLDCKESYRNWSCAFYFHIYDGSENTTDADELRFLCAEASRRCPLLIPLDVHSGQPFFTCSGVRALQETTMREEPCDTRLDGCYITERDPNVTVENESITANNIGRNRARISAVMLLLNLLLPVVHLIRGHPRLV